MGCRYIQGWLICEALPTQDLAQKFNSHELHACLY
jgi:EAL domain-containing protein (putative c-di-GMP-specific phosphodiesterase class I)